MCLGYIKFVLRFAYLVSSTYLCYLSLTKGSSYFYEGCMKGYDSMKVWLTSNVLLRQNLSQLVCGSLNRRLWWGTEW